MLLQGFYIMKMSFSLVTKGLLIQCGLNKGIFMCSLSDFFHNVIAMNYQEKSSLFMWRQKPVCNFSCTNWTVLMKELKEQQ